MNDMKKYVLDLRVNSVTRLHERYVLIKAMRDERLPMMMPGQFVEIRIDGEPGTFLRRPISINYVDRENNELWLLVAVVGNGTRHLSKLHVGDGLNVIAPLGHGFSLPHGEWLSEVLLVGGGVGVAPLLYQGAMLRQNGIKPVFLLGARTSSDLLMLDEFRKYGERGRLCRRAWVRNPAYGTGKAPFRADSDLWAYADDEGGGQVCLQSGH